MAQPKAPAKTEKGEVARSQSTRAEVDALRARQGRLVRADPAGDPLAGDGQRGRLRKRRVEGTDDAVLQDHVARIARR